MSNNFATHLGIPVTTGSADPARQRDHLSIEAAARQDRYTFLIETALAQNATLIALGHHRDDQAETVLMHLLRGTGLGGLRGMLPEAPLSETHLAPDASDALFNALEDLILIRPMLGVSREMIRDFAAEHELQPREDLTNDDTTLLRNRLRHEIMPLLETVNPTLREALARLALITQGDHEIVQGVVEKIMAQVVEWGDTDDGEIAYVDRLLFLKQPRGMQRQLMRRFVSDLTSETDIAYHQIETACDLVDQGETGQQLILPRGLKLSLGYDEFTLHYGGDIPFPRQMPHLRPGQVVPLGLEGQGFQVNGMRFYTYWVLEGRSREIYRADLLEATLVINPDDELSLRTRRPGDRFFPLGMEGHSQKLADIFTNLKVPQALRDRVPLLTVNDQIAWFVAPTVSGIQGRVAEPFAVKPDSDSVLRVRWEVLE